MVAASCAAPHDEWEPQEVAPLYAYFSAYDNCPSVPEGMRPELEAFMKVLGADATDDSTLAAWAHSPAVRVFTPDVDSVYPSLSAVESQIGRVLSRASSEGLSLPKRRYAAVVWGKPESIIFCDTVVLMALNHYLGADYPGYSHIDAYLRKDKKPARLVYDVAEALVATAMPYVRTEESTVLSRLLYEGALAEARMRLAGGGAAASLGYDEQEYDELVGHERELWELLVGRGLLYSTLPSDATRLVAPAPSTNILTSKAPGRAGRFIGHRIVRAYLERNPETSLEELLSPEFYNSGRVLLESGYVGG